MEVLKNEDDYVQERCLGGDADRHGRQGVPLGVWNCTLTHVKDLIKGYVESCPYDCDWTIRGGGMKIQGKSRQDDYGHACVWHTKDKCGKKVAG